MQALKHGAYDYITKPVDPDELSHLVANALEHKRARREVVRLRENLQEVVPGTELIGKSPAMQQGHRADRNGGAHRSHGADHGRDAAPARKWWRAPSTRPVRGATCRW